MSSPVPLTLGGDPAPRADASRNRSKLLAVAREMIDEGGVGVVTMDGLAERAQLGKGTVFRRFGSRAGIFRALLDDDERTFQHRVISGPPPLGPGASPHDRLLAYGAARVPHLLAHRDILASALDSRAASPVGPESTFSRMHIRVLLAARRPDLDPELADALAVQLLGALEAPIVLYMPAVDHPDSAAIETMLVRGWEALVEALAT